VTAPGNEQRQQRHKEIFWSDASAFVCAQPTPSVKYMIQLGSKYSLAREKWIGRHYEGLKREYRDEWVAVLNSGVLTVTMSWASLLKGCVADTSRL
jgi:hypothetical protein